MAAVDVVRPSSPGHEGRHLRAKTRPRNPNARLFKTRAGHRWRTDMHCIAWPCPVAGLRVVDVGTQVRQHPIKSPCWASPDRGAHPQQERPLPWRHCPRGCCNGLCGLSSMIVSACRIKCIRLAAVVSERQGSFRHRFTRNCTLWLSLLVAFYLVFNGFLRVNRLVMGTAVSANKFTRS